MAEITLRRFLVSDAKELALLGNNPTVSKNLRDTFPQPYTEENAHAYLAMCEKENRAKSLSLAICVDNTFAGAIGVSIKDDVYRKTAELGYWLGEPFWGRGIATEAVRLMIRRAFLEYEINRIFAEVFAENRSSCRVLEKCRFRKEGIMRHAVYKNGVYDDAVIYGLLREEQEE